MNSQKNSLIFARDLSWITCKRINFSKSYFTLIELLIVVAAIAILISILIPSLSIAKEKSRIAVCASNQSQIYKHAMIWSNNENGWTPYGNSWHIYSGSNNLKQGSNDTWMAMGRLVKDNIITEPDVLNCPSEKGTFQYGTVNKPFKQPFKPNLTCFNFSTIIQKFSTSNGELESGSKKFFVSMFDKEAVSMDAYWFKGFSESDHINYSNVAYSSGHVKLVYHNAMSPREKIVSWDQSFNTKVNTMWKKLEDNF